jgi:hypothetical protein
VPPGQLGNNLARKRILPEELAVVYQVEVFELFA